MDRGKDLEQHKVVDLHRGLFVVQYKNADDLTSPPRVSVSAAPGHERNVEFLLHPDSEESVLWQPNTSLVIRVLAPATLRVQVLPMRQNGSRAATVQIEPLSQGIAPVIQQIGRGFAIDTASLATLRLVGHVAGIGDVIVGSNAWIAGPSAPSRVEGIAIEWPNKPDDIDIRYAVKFATAQANSGKMVPLGTYAGTRGRALPITGVVLEMTGAGSESCEFIAEAVFLSAPTLRATGRRVVLSGPTGREPLVGLRINIESNEENLLEAPPVADAPRKAPSPGRVRVFRSRPRQNATAE